MTERRKRLSFAKVVAHVEVDTAKDIVGGETALTIVVGMEDGIGAKEPTGVVPDDAQTRNAIHVDIVEIEVAEDSFGGTIHIGNGLLVAQGHLQRGIEKPVVGEDPVVGISAGQRIVGILDI